MSMMMSTVMSTLLHNVFCVVLCDAVPCHAVFLQRDGRKVQQSTVSNISPAHAGASYTATGLQPGQPYQFTVTPK